MSNIIELLDDGTGIQFGAGDTNGNVSLIYGPIPQLLLLSPAPSNELGTEGGIQIFGQNGPTALVDSITSVGGNNMDIRTGHGGSCQPCTSAAWRGTNGNKGGNLEITTGNGSNGGDGTNSVSTVGGDGGNGGYIAITCGHGGSGGSSSSTDPMSGRGGNGGYYKIQAGNGGNGGSVISGSTMGGDGGSIGLYAGIGGLGSNSNNNGANGTIDFAVANMMAAQIVPDGRFAIFNARTTAYSNINVVDNFSVNISNNVNVVLLNSSIDLSTGSITLPDTPLNGQSIIIIPTNNITTVSISAAAGHSITGNISTMTSHRSVQFIFIQPTNLWFAWQ